MLNFRTVIDVCTFFNIEKNHFTGKCVVFFQLKKFTGTNVNKYLLQQKWIFVCVSVFLVPEKMKFN